MTFNKLFARVSTTLCVLFAGPSSARAQELSELSLPPNGMNQKARQPVVSVITPVGPSTNTLDRDRICN